MRPQKRRCVRFDPKVTYFKPRGVPMSSLQEIELKPDEIEAIRLKNIEKLDQHACAREMEISQSTFQRILVSANHKVAEALINGKAIKVSASA